MRVKGEGPVPCSVVLVGEAPGRDEEQSGRPFVGKSGQELNRILERAGLDRSDIYVTNICKLRPPYVNGKQQPPSAEDIARDEGELIDELLRTKPRWVGALGRVAAGRLCDGFESMEAHWGLPLPLSREMQVRLRSGMDDEWIDECQVIPLYHPAAGLHNADLSAFVWRGIGQFGDYVRGVLRPVAPVDNWAGNEHYTEEVSGSPVLRDQPVACDTEGVSGSPWGGSVSSTAGTALVTRLPNTPHLAQVLDRAPVTVFHHLLHDAEILREMGVELDWQKCEDTMLMAYCLRLVPQGLKQLARRFCGMSMQSYLDVVAPAERRLASEWVDRALAANQCPLCEGNGKVREMRKDGKGLKKSPVKCRWEDEQGRRCIDGGMWVEREERLEYDWDKGEWKTVKGWSVGRYLRKLRSDIATGTFEVDSDGEDEEGESPSIRKRVGNWPDDVLKIIETQVGEMPVPTLDDIPREAATYYSARDADATIRIYPILSEQIDALGLRGAYRLDLSVVPIAAEMQRNGMYIDKEYFNDFAAELQRDKQITLARIESHCGRPINPASGEQVAGVLFGDRGLSYSPDDAREFGSATGIYELEPEKWTKGRSRASVDDKTLEGIKLKYAQRTDLVRFIDLVTDYRIMDKIEGTYARKIPLLADEYSRVHTQIKMARTATFRWSSADPNLQNIPARPKGGKDLGKRVRAGFKAPPGYVLGSWDFDQIEMRVLAWYSQDANLLRVFREGLDIHSLTAALVFRIPFDQFMAELKGEDKALAGKRKDQRASAKNIGFGVVYGVTAKGLKAQMELRGQHWTEEECQALIDMYLHQAYPGVGRFMMDAHAEARRYGYVRSLFGHIRYMPGVHSSIASVREEALRQAANFKIQCTAAELLKVSMRRLWEEYKPVLDEVGSSILMAVHDELLLQVPDNPEAREITDAVVTSAMTDPVLLEGVSVGTSGKYDYDWSLLK
jgi:uracil-DNA glycosylase family 4